MNRLDTDRNLWLCTLRPDGSPHVTPVWFTYLDNTFWIASGKRNIKVSNILNDPRVSLALENADNPIVAEGRARIHNGTLPHHVLEAISTKYDGWDAAKEIPPFGLRVLLEVPVGRWLLKGTAQ